MTPPAYIALRGAAIGEAAVADLVDAALPQLGRVALADGE